MFFGAVMPSTSVLQNEIGRATGEYARFSGQHHPVGCKIGELALHEDGSLQCEHGKSRPNCPKVGAALSASAAVLLFEVLWEQIKPSS